MNGVLIDSCVLLDIATEDPVWFDWSAEKIEECSERYSLFINPIIFAEVSAGYERIEEVEHALPSMIYRRAPLPWEAAFLAGKAFLRYRKSGGKREIPLPDFFIGAHAVIENFVLLTRDTKRFGHYFPALKMISPLK